MASYVIMGYVRRGGGPPQKASWDGRSWTRQKAKVYPSMAAAQKAANAMNVKLVDSVTIMPIGCR
jgi:predicted lysophospholipase L1 biosynthesis ABC-type transport system permease subunit